MSEVNSGVPPSAADLAKSAPGSGTGTHHPVIAFLLDYWWLFFAVIVAAHVVAWTVGNTESTRVHWVFFTTNSSIGVVIAVAVVLGVLFTLLVSQQRSRGAKAAARVRSERSIRDVKGSDG